MAYTTSNYIQNVRDKTFGMVQGGQKYASLRAGFNTDTSAIPTQEYSQSVVSHDHAGDYAGQHQAPERALSALKAQGEQQRNMSTAVNNAQQRPAVTGQQNTASNISGGIVSMRAGTAPQQQQQSRPSQNMRYRQDVYAGDVGQQGQNMSGPMFNAQQGLLEHPQQIAAYIEQFFRRFAYGGR